MEDSKILELFLAQAEQAIPALEEKYGNACRRIAENILKNRLDAEECVNDAYLALWNTIPPQKPEPLRAYAYRVVRNLSITRYHANTAQKRNSYYDAALEELEPCLASVETVEQAESQPSATLSEKTSRGVFQPRHFLGRSLRRSSTACTSSSVIAWKSKPLGKKNRIRSLVFSLVPRCQGLCGSAK